MGSAKALLDAGGQSFLARVVSALAAGGCDPVVVVARDPAGAVAEEAGAAEEASAVGAMAGEAGAAGATAGEPAVAQETGAVGAVAQEAGAAGAVVAVNRAPDEGPISSIRVALEGWGNGVDGCAICPVDHPLVTSATVRSLAARFAETAAAIVVPTYRGRRGHPAIFHRRLFAELLDPTLPEGARTVVRRRASRVRECPVEDPGVVADIDTPSEYRRHFRVA